MNWEIHTLCVYLFLIHLISLVFKKKACEKIIRLLRSQHPLDAKPIGVTF